MAEITNELIYEVLKQLQERMASFERKLDEVKSAVAGIAHPLDCDPAGYSEYLCDAHATRDTAATASNEGSKSPR